MQVLLPSIALTSMALVAQACTRVHTDLTYALFEGDFMYVQVWDNGKEVCHGQQTKYGANRDTEWCFDSSNGCQPGHKICVRNNGKEGTYTNEGHYTGEVKLQNGDDTGNYRYDCLCNDQTCLKCQEFETCLTDNFGNCGSYPKCKRCDYRGFC